MRLGLCATAARRLVFPSHRVKIRVASVEFMLLTRRSMGYPITKPWHPWEYKDGPYQQIGGYAIEFAVPGRFVFTTVRGGRHEVPETAPDRAFEMLKRFLNGEKF